MIGQENYTHLTNHQPYQRSDVEACCTACLWMMHDLSVSTPPIGFSARATAFIAYVGASIDVDTYRDDDPGEQYGAGQPSSHSESK